jgi:hypothetical protein
VLYTKLKRSQVRGGKERRREGRSKKGKGRLLEHIRSLYKYLVRHSPLILIRLHEK